MRIKKIIIFIIPIFFLLLLLPNKKAGAFSENEYESSLEKIPEKIEMKIDKEIYTPSKTEILFWIKEKTDLTFDSNYHSEIENINICSYKKSLSCRLSFPYNKEISVRKLYTKDIKKDSIEKFLKDLSRKINRDPQNAKLKIENGKVSVFSLSSPGIQLDEEKSFEIIETYIKGKNHSETIDLPFREILPEIPTDSIDNLGIIDLIGEGKSDFKGSPKNRIYNIKLATNRFNGILIKPNEEFSFVKILGEVDEEHGYLPELVIKKDKTEPEFGGGICQVSTTAFRAAINSGLEITARKSHAYPVSYYYPHGMDASIYIPRPDLRFINNTSGHILIETKIEGTELTFKFYGTPDGRKVNIIGPNIIEKNSDGSMKTTFTQQVLDENNNLLKEDIFNSSYDSPDKYPKPGEENLLTEKPKKWSENEWKKYKKDHGL